MIPSEKLSESINLEESIEIFQAGELAMKNKIYGLAKSLFKNSGLRFVDAGNMARINLIW